MSVTYLDVEGGKLAVEVREPAGAAAGTPAPLVVCSPSLGDTRDSYYALVDRLVAAGYRVALADLRGHGASSTSFARYGDEATAADFLAMVDAFAKGDAPVVLVGSSLSSAAATIAAGQQPGRVAGLVLLSPFLRAGVSPLVRHLMNVLFWWPWGPAVWRLYAATLWPGLPAEARTARAAATTAALQAKAGGWAAFQATLAGADHDAMVPRWLGKARHVPALVVVGDKDPDYGSPAAEADWVAAQFYGADGQTTATTLLVEGAGHAPMYERPDEVGPAVVRFLDGLREGTGFRPAKA